MMEWLPVFSILAGLSPGFVVYLIGIVVSLVYRGRFPMPSRIVLIACTGYILLDVLQAIAHGWHLPHMRAATESTNVQLAIQTTVLSLGISILYAGMSGLMIWAVFAGRRKKTK